VAVVHHADDGVADQGRLDVLARQRLDLGRLRSAAAVGLGRGDGARGGGGEGGGTEPNQQGDGMAAAWRRRKRVMEISLPGEVDARATAPDVSPAARASRGLRACRVSRVKG
jgi:hypothetical protein